MRRLILFALVIGLMSNPASAGEKSPKTAFFMSLLMPGLGEFYAGAKWRGAGFMATEAITWLAYFSWRSKGNDLKADFRVFADQHWNESRYDEWRAYNASQPQSEQYYETEHLPDKVTGDTQQYYELIGKYDQFVFGWDDVTVPLTSDNASVLSALRENYETQRNESNKYLKRASRIVGLAVVMRIASAIHASACTQARQSSSQSLWVEVSPFDRYGRPGGAVELKTRF